MCLPQYSRFEYFRENYVGFSRKMFHSVSWSKQQINEIKGPKNYFVLFRIRMLYFVWFCVIPHRYPYVCKFIFLDNKCILVLSILSSCCIIFRYKFNWSIICNYDVREEVITKNRSTRMQHKLYVNKQHKIQ